MEKQYLTLLSIGILLTVSLIANRPTPAITEDRLIAVTATIEEITERDEGLILSTKENDVLYHIDELKELGFSLQELRPIILNQEVTLRYPDLWMPSESYGTKHLSELIFQGEVIYSELKADLVAKN